MEFILIFKKQLDSKAQTSHIKNYYVVTYYLLCQQKIWLYFNIINDM